MLSAVLLVLGYLFVCPILFCVYVSWPGQLRPCIRRQRSLRGCGFCVTYTHFASLYALSTITLFYLSQCFTHHAYLSGFSTITLLLVSVLYAITHIISGFSTITLFYLSQCFMHHISQWLYHSYTLACLSASHITHSVALAQSYSCLSASRNHTNLSGFSTIILFLVSVLHAITHALSCCH